MIAPLALLLGACVVVALVAVLVRTGVSERDVAWIAGSVPASPAESAVYARYLRRHRSHRVVGGLFGVTFAVVVGLAWFGGVFVGIGRASVLADPLFCGMAGVLVGALSAETFRLSEPRSATVMASLAEHPGGARPVLVRWARILSVASFGCGAALAATGNGLEAGGIAVCGLAVMAVAEATQAAISGRRRPVLSERARAVDLRIRSFASVSVARLQLAAAVLVTAWTLSAAPLPASGPVAVMAVVGMIGALLVAVILLRNASPRPPSRWIAAPS